MNNVTVLGCGRWASLHAWYSALLGNKVMMWEPETSPTYQQLQKTRRNEYLTLPNDVKLTSNLGQALDHSNYVVVAISAQGMGDLSAKIAAHKPANKTFMLCMKGLMDDGTRLSTHLRNQLDEKGAGNNEITVWVGSGHAQTLTKGDPSVMIVGGERPQAAADVVQRFSSDLIALRQGNDLIGIEIGAASKNVAGLAAGMLDGMKLSGLKSELAHEFPKEISRLTVALGGEQDTAFGISHLGDYGATVFSPNSQNRLYGEKFVTGQHSDRLAEGVAASSALQILSNKHDTEIPISTLVYKILHENENPDRLRKLFMNGTSGIKQPSTAVKE